MAYQSEIMSKPTIHVLCGPGASETVLRQLQNGMEEEGVPWETETRQAGDSLALAWDGAQASRLGVGLGLDGENLTLHFFQLEEKKPLFQIPARSPGEQVMALGANAARLIKKLPLKPLGRR